MPANGRHRPGAPDRVAAIVRGLEAAFVACSSSGRCSGPGRGLWPAAQGGQTSSLHDLGQFAGCGTNEVASIQQQQQQTVSPAQGLLRQPQCPAEDIITTLPVQVCGNEDSGNAHKVGMIFGCVQRAIGLFLYPKANSQEHGK